MKSWRISQPKLLVAALGVVAIMLLFTTIFQSLSTNPYLQQLLIKPATKRVAGQSPAIGFIFLFVAGLKANCCNNPVQG